MATLSIVAGVQEYIQAMVDRISGMKVLLLDEETIGIISMVFSQSDILQHEVDDHKNTLVCSPVCRAAWYKDVRSACTDIGCDSFLLWHAAFLLDATESLREVNEAISALTAVGSEGSDGVRPALVSIQPPPGTARTPSDICCVVDVSGSMSNDALLQSEDGTMSASHGLSVLDIVKHALRTIIAILGENDRLALVSYSNAAKTIFPLTEMNEHGRKFSEGKLEELIAEGMTNLWDGLQTGLNLLKEGAQANRLQHVMLFTDGLPNINPPRGILPMLKRLKDKSEGGRLPCTISTFGFGYELDSALLSQLATDGFGTYAFIPDAGFVGTVFVNAMSNLLVTMARDVVVTLKPVEGAAFAEPKSLLGSHAAAQGEALRVHLGTLQFGQAKDLVVLMRGSGERLVEATVEYTTRAGPGPPLAAAGGADPALVELHRLRLKGVDCIQQAMASLKLTAMDRANGKALPLEEASRIIQAMISEISSSSAGDAEAAKGLREDFEGQVSEAISREDWYQKWGIHYLPSLMSAHLAQQCNNFKDAGVQSYGGELFQNIRDAADDVFLSLPPPQPTARPQAAQAAPTASRVRSPYGHVLYAISGHLLPVGGGTHCVMSKDMIQACKRQ
ncbi:yfbK [Symbiodinium natans]|uniref:YfbK protein n=1 Tax=Symbiodinium natans TaxID=878477 RepID=A0A812Q5R0_9DINO|nr:yfbK [Symbiodinium natans]